MVFRAVPESLIVFVRWDLQARKLGSLRAVTHNTEKQFQSRSLQDSRFQIYRISRQSIPEDGKVVKPKHWQALPSRKYSSYSFLSQPQGHSAAGRK